MRELQTGSHALISGVDDLERQIEAAGGTGESWARLCQPGTRRTICVHFLGDEWVVEANGALINIGQAYPGPRTPVTRRECLAWAARRGYIEVIRVELPQMAGRALLAAYAGGKRCFQRLNLNGVCLEGAHLEGIDLRGTRLCWAVLRGVWLEGALLSGAECYGADLRGAHLEGVDLTRADLHGARMTG